MAASVRLGTAGPAPAPESLDIRAYDHAPDAARAIRLAAFTALAGVRPEFDDWDNAGRAVHLLAFAGSSPVATCRFYPDPDHPEQPGRYVIARLAVTPALQGHGIGTHVLADAESRVRAAGGRLVAVHAERSMFPYYERLGYAPTSDMYDGDSHGWLVKPLS